MLPGPSKLRRFSPRKTGDASPLGQLERAVMEAVWSIGEPVSVGQLHASLSASPPIAYTTVKTTMERLADKGILTRARHGKAYHYGAALSQQDLERRIVAGALDRLVEEFPEAVASFCVRPDPGLTDERLALLQEAIDRQRKQGDGER